MSTMFLSAGRTETGKVRQRNEDAILVREDLGLWVVADGLGGHAAGEYASGMIVQRLAGLHRDGSVHDFIESIEDCLYGVNRELIAAAAARQVDVIASTVAMLIHDRDFMLCGWVGDSRVYCYEHGLLRQLTRDHVHGPKHDVTQLGAAPATAGALTRAVGAQTELSIDWVVACGRPGMQWVVCSDGVNKELSDRELEHACACHRQPRALLESIFAQAMQRRARDNISAIAVRLLDG